tara:strand:- start:222 stop:806 length:585 start_codon:yes stop_codon:yes gene_type:complete
MGYEMSAQETERASERSAYHQEMRDNAFEIIEELIEEFGIKRVVGQDHGIGQILEDDEVSDYFHTQLNQQADSSKYVIYNILALRCVSDYTQNPDAYAGCLTEFAAAKAIEEDRNPLFAMATVMAYYSVEADILDHVRHIMSNERLRLLTQVQALPTVIKSKAKAEQLAQIERADLNEAKAIAELNHRIEAENK